MFGEVWIGLASTVGGTDLPQPQLDLLTKAVLQRCVGQDGRVANGCVPDRPARLLIQSGDAAMRDRARTPARASAPLKCGAARKIYRGPRDTLTGQKISPGLAVGSETFWRQVLVGTPLPGGSSLSFFRDAVFDDPNFDFGNFNFGADVDVTNNKVFAGQTLAQILNANDTNLEPFRHAGASSSCIMAGPIRSCPRSSASTFIPGSPSTRRSPRPRKRLPSYADFAPAVHGAGMNHCAAGRAPTISEAHISRPVPPLDRQHDMVEALDAWVSHGVAPEQIVAVKYNNDQPADGVAFSARSARFRKQHSTGGKVIRQAPRVSPAERKSPTITGRRSSGSMPTRTACDSA